MSDEEICDVDRTVCDARMRMAVAAELRSLADMFEHAPDLYAAGELRARADQLDPSGATPGGEPHGG